MKKVFLITVGYLALFFGVVGIFVPLLPTTPFLLLAAACFAKSSDSLYHWLTQLKLVGPHIIYYQQFRAISKTSKILSIVALWISISFSIIFFINFLWLQILLFVIAVGVTIHILRFRTLTKEIIEQQSLQ